ncbi:hypothetical protein LCGC14_2318300, partial [marine sediment metagenome]
FDIQNIKGLWRFDELYYDGTVGEVKDETESNYGTTNGGVITTSDAKFGRAAYFDGYDDYVEIPDNGSMDLSSSSFTVEAWSKRLGTNNESGTIMATGGTDWAQGFMLQHRNDGLWAQVSDGQGDGINIQALDKGLYDNNWHHFVLVVNRNTDTAQGYIDGKDVTGPVDISTEDDLHLDGTPIRIGRLADHSTTDQFNFGLIDEPKVYEGALSSNEISNRYQSYMYKTGGSYLLQKYGEIEPAIDIENEPKSLKTRYSEDWLESAPIKIDNSLNNKTLTDYQVKLEIVNKPGMKPDFSDLRFTDSDKISELPYWLEKKTDNSTTTVWVKVPNITASSTKTLYMYYGNSAATSTSDGDSVFEDFDVKGIEGNWKFDEASYNGTSGDVKDQTGIHDGKSLGGLTSTNDAKFGKAAQFDGTNDSIELGNWFAYQNFTISMWVNPADTQKQWATIIDNASTPDVNWILEQENNILNRYLWWMTDGSTNPVALFYLTPNQWSHITISRNQATKENNFYVNGQLISRAVGKSLINYDGNQFLRIGNHADGNRNWNGKIDEVNIFDRALSDAEIAI